MERVLIEHCAETLVGLKIANLFSYSYESLEILHQKIIQLIHVLSKNGIAIRCLKLGPKRALIYVYRELELEERLKETQIREFLLGFGYHEWTLEEHLNYLSGRLMKGGEFPHEIGIFLDYPLEDVIGFIENKGQAYKAKGYWKVYDQESMTVERFKQFRKCRNILLKRYLSGVSLEQLVRH